MKLIIKKRSLPDILALLSLAIFLVISIINTTFYLQYLSGLLYNGGIIFAILLLIIKEFIRGKYGWDTFLGIAIVALLYVIIGTATSFNDTVAIGVIFIYGLRDVPFIEVAKVSFIVSALVLVFVIFSSKIGIVTNYVEISGNRIRNYLGFRYALFPSSLLLNIVAIVFYLKQGNIRYWQWLLLSMSVYWIYIQTDSRLTFYSSCSLLLCNLLIKWFPNLLSKAERLFYIFSFTYFVNALISVLASISYLESRNPFVNDMFYKLNQFLGGRLYLSNRSLKLYGFGMFGKDVDWVGNGLSADGQKSTRSYLYVDNLYIQLLQRYGMLVLVLVLGLLTATLLKLFKKGQWVLGIILILMSFHSVIDDLNLNLHYNIFWVLLGSLIYSDYRFSNSKQD